MPNEERTTTTRMHQAAQAGAQRPAAEAGRPESHSPARRPWSPPAVETLPRLTELTLETAGPSVPGGGDTGSGGSTVF